MQFEQKVSVTGPVGDKKIQKVVALRFPGFKEPMSVSEISKKVKQYSNRYRAQMDGKASSHEEGGEVPNAKGSPETSFNRAVMFLDGLMQLDKDEATACRDYVRNKYNIPL